MSNIAVSVSFNDIPPSLRVPGAYLEIDNSGALQGLPVIWYKLLVIGQKLPAGGQPAATPLLITGGKAQADAAFGQGSMLSLMVQAARKANDYTEMWAIALDDNSAGAAATGSVALAGTATAAGTYQLYVGGVPIQVAVTVGMTGTALATALAAAIAANADLPVTASTAIGTVTLTARHKGVEAGQIDLRNLYYQGDAIPAGITSTITQMSGGSANPLLASVINAMGDDPYHAIILPYNDTASVTALNTELTRRFSGLVQKDSHAYGWVPGTVGTLASWGTTQDSPHLSVLGASNLPTPGFVAAAVYGAVAAYYLSDDPARPLRTLALPGLLAPAPADRFSWTNRNLLLHDGIGTFVVDPDGTMRIERSITTYQLNGAGAQDASYLQTETMATIAYVRFSWVNRMLIRFPRYKLADDAPTPPPPNTVTPRVVAAEQLAWFVEMVDAGICEDVAQFKATQIVVRNRNDNTRIDSIVPAHLVSGLQVIAGKLRFLL